MSKKAILLIFTVVIIGNSSRADLNFNRDDIVHNARIGIDLSGSFSQVNVNLIAEGTTIGGQNSALNSAYQQIQRTISNIYQLKLKFNPALNSSYN